VVPQIGRAQKTGPFSICLNNTGTVVLVFLHPEDLRLGVRLSNGASLEEGCLREQRKGHTLLFNGLRAGSARNEKAVAQGPGQIVPSEPLGSFPKV
jgi:hypothetical protein